MSQDMLLMNSSFLQRNRWSTSSSGNVVQELVKEKKWYHGAGCGRMGNKWSTGCSGNVMQYKEKIFNAVIIHRQSTFVR